MARHNDRQSYEVLRSRAKNCGIKISPRRNMLLTALGLQWDCQMDNFDVLRKTFGPGSLSFAKWSLRRGEHLSPEKVAAVKEANHSWQEDAEFVAFDLRSNGGQKQRRGRPRDTDLQPRERIADAFYPPVLEYIQRKRKNGSLTAWLKLLERRLGYIDETLPNNLFAAEALKSYFGLKLTSTRFLRRMTERQTGHRYKPISQV